MRRRLLDKGGGGYTFVARNLGGARCTVRAPCTRSPLALSVHGVLSDRRVPCPRERLHPVLLCDDTQTYSSNQLMPLSIDFRHSPRI